MINTSTKPDSPALDADFMAFGLVCKRDPNGVVRANVPQVICHSPPGFECGSQNPGTLDLALSTLHALLPPPSLEEESRARALTGAAFEEARRDASRWSTRLPRGIRVNLLVSLRYEAFAQDFLVGMSESGGSVAISDIRAWLNNRGTSIDSATHLDKE